MAQAKIIGTGSYLPSKVLTNQDLEKIVETSDEWIVTRTGMKERRIAAANEYASDMGIQAANQALTRAGIKPEEVDCILVATSTPDYQAMSTACIVQHALGAYRASAMDIQAACSGYLYGLFTAKSFIESGVYQNILLVAPEKLSSIVNYEDRTTCILFGDGAAACLISSKNVDGFKIHGMVLGSDGAHASLGLVPGGGCRHPASLATIDERKHFIQMNGSEIFKHAVRKMEEASKASMELVGLTEDHISWLVPHQANLRIIQAMEKRFSIPKEKIYVTIHKYGNTSASSIGIALDELVQTNPIDEEENILLTAFGFGLTWGAGVLTYQKGAG